MSPSLYVQPSASIIVLAMAIPPGPGAPGYWSRLPIKSLGRAIFLSLLYIIPPLVWRYLANPMTFCSLALSWTRWIGSVIAISIEPFSISSNASKCSFGSIISISNDSSLNQPFSIPKIKNHSKPTVNLSIKNSSIHLIIA